MTASNRDPWPPNVVFVAMMAAVLVLGFVDWASGYEFSFFVFYFAPVAFAAWHSGNRRAYLVALLSIVVWSFADALSGHLYSHISFRLWAGFVRLVSFLVIADTFARLKHLLDEEQRKSERLQKALSEVKSLSGLLPICASCKKIRNDSGYWQRLEEFIGQRTDAHFTHGLCEECLTKVRREGGLDKEQPTV